MRAIRSMLVKSQACVCASGMIRIMERSRGVPWLFNVFME